MDLNIGERSGTVRFLTNFYTDFGVVGKIVSLASVLAVGLILAGCGGSESGRSTAADRGEMAARWAGAQYSVAMFDQHCAKVASGRPGARRSALSHEVRWLLRQASLSSSDVQRRYADAQLANAASALYCEPDLARKLIAAK